MTRRLDDIDARILELIQLELPLDARPFDAIAKAVSIAPEEALNRIRRMKSDGIIRQISAIFDSTALGYIGALVAFKVSDEALEHVASNVAAHSSVSHCYSRNADYNLWFTLTIGPDDDLDRHIDELALLDGVQSHMTLPAIKVFKIGVFLKLTGAVSSDDHETNLRRKISSGLSTLHSPLSIKVAKALQTDLPLVERPFSDLAGQSGMSEVELLNYARAFLDNGVMRRYAAVLRHRKVGYTFNAMICWQVEPDMIDETGYRFAQRLSVSHCYQRPTFPDWPYALYTMVHSRSQDELDSVIAELVLDSHNSPHLILNTITEYKKTRVSYFHS
ncbi:MAG: Lrp/AsnC family transcriptional regulator [Armatimonadota bacterium]|nr:Lrp/AsnC family transcriptional regulator [bacterium]